MAAVVVVIFLTTTTTTTTTTPSFAYPVIVRVKVYAKRRSYVKHVKKNIPSNQSTNDTRKHLRADLTQQHTTSDNEVRLRRVKKSDFIVAFIWEQEENTFMKSVKVKQRFLTKSVTLHYSSIVNKSTIIAESRAKRIVREMS
ncbi:hypothetical protein GQX74_013351 [Glossina fuscipes]|nr:hypothetical protein GQX74_013351 [Glossina fuscipes]